MNYETNQRTPRLVLADRIKAELKAGPMTVLDLAATLHLAPPKILTALKYMCAHYLGIEPTPDSWPRTYRLLEAVKPKPLSKNGSGVIGLPIREREERPLKRNFFELRDLAMTTRRA